MRDRISSKLICVDMVSPTGFCLVPRVTAIVWLRFSRIYGTEGVIHGLRDSQLGLQYWVVVGRQDAVTDREEVRIDVRNLRAMRD